MNIEDQPLVSIIVPCYNQAAYMKDTLDCILTQSYRNWECVMVNDGSSDETEKISKMYCEKDKRFHYVYQENQGPSATRNHGISISKGEYILPLDADDIIDPTYVEKAITILETQPNVKVVYCKAKKFGYENGPWILDDYSYDKFIITNCVFCSCLFRRKDYDATSGYNENMKYGYEDWDFLLSLIQPEDKVVCIPEVLFHYRIKSPTVSSTNTRVLHHMDFALKQIVKNHPDIYKEYFDDVLYLIKTSEFIKQKNFELLHSPYYKVGLWVLLPYRIWNHIKRKLKR